MEKRRYESIIVIGIVAIMIGNFTYVAYKARNHWQELWSEKTKYLLAQLPDKQDGTYLFARILLIDGKNNIEIITDYDLLLDNREQVLLSDRGYSGPVYNGYTNLYKDGRVIETVNIGPDTMYSYESWGTLEKQFRRVDDLSEYLNLS